MALVKSALLAQISGSIGGSTFARNRGGAYARNRTVPINPRRPDQVRARSQLSEFSVSWSDVLTSAQRSAWQQYAESLQAQNRLGDDIVLTGQQAYVQASTLLQLAGLSAITDPPVSNVQFALAANPQVVTHDISDNDVEVILTTGITASLLAFCSRPISPGSLSNALDYRFFGVAAITNLTTCAVTGTNSTRRVFVAGMGQFWRFRAVTSTGQFSNILTLRGLSQA